jgi:hypothetical protein
MYCERHTVGFFAAAVGNVMSIIFFCLFAAGVLKLFQIHTTLGELKDLLTTLKNRQDLPAVSDTRVAVGAPSGEEMLRALDREMHLDGDKPALDPEVIEPR